MTSYPGKEEQVVVQENGYNPSLSPDGDRLLYNDAQEVLLKDMKTGITTNLTGGIDEQCSEPIWSPDGTRLAYIRKHQIHIEKIFETVEGR